LQSPQAIGTSKRFDYLLNSHANPHRYYTGVTSDVPMRLADHNGGRCTHTASGRPWVSLVVIEFTTNDEHSTLNAL